MSASYHAGLTVNIYKGIFIFESRARDGESEIFDLAAAGGTVLGQSQGPGTSRNSLTWAIFCYFLRAIAERWVESGSIWNSNWHPYGVLASLVVVLSAMSQ